MWLAVPSPSPSGINVTVSVPPDTALDTYTGVLAAATVLLAGFTVALAVIGWRALQRQDREIKATEEQLRLTREDFDARRNAALPVLEVEAQVIASTAAFGQVIYVAASDPAYHVVVWARAVGGCYGWEVGTLTPSKSPIDLPRDGLPALPTGTLGTTWPFKRAMEAIELDATEVWNGLTWTSPNGAERRFLRHLAADAYWYSYQDGEAN